MINKEAIEELQKIVREDYQRELSFDDARSIAEGLVGYYDTLSRINHYLNFKETKYEEDF